MNPGEIDVSATAWRASLACNSNGTCVEVASFEGRRVGVRDGKRGAAGPFLTFAADEWRAFLEHVKNGRLDPG